MIPNDNNEYKPPKRFTLGRSEIIRQIKTVILLSVLSSLIVLPIFFFFFYTPSFFKSHKQIEKELKDKGFICDGNCKF